VLAGFENLFMAHNTWFLYATAMRIFKHYHLNVKDPATAATSLSFSSYAGSTVIFHSTRQSKTLLPITFANVDRFPKLI